jgi:hypothetical protein
MDSISKVVSSLSKRVFGMEETFRLSLESYKRTDSGISISTIGPKKQHGVLHLSLFTPQIWRVLFEREKEEKKFESFSVIDRTDSTQVLISI